MLDIMVFVEWLKTTLGGSFYPLLFPSTATAECSVVTLSDVLGRRRDVKNLECTIFVRSARPDTGIVRANEIINRLDRETSLSFGTTQVLSILAKTSSGKFQGQDENGHYVFTASFDIIICDL